MVTSAKQEHLMLIRGYISVRKVADQMGVAATTVYRAIREGKLKALSGPGIKYVPVIEVIQWLGIEKARTFGFVLPAPTSGGP